jgi:DNA-binding CsgD family transcriptional regulator
MELQILEMIGQGESSTAIGSQTGITIEEVADKCTGIQSKLKLDSWNDLVRYAVCWVETGRF